MTGHLRQTALASSICNRAGPVLPIGKNSSGSSSRQAARWRQSIGIGLLRGDQSSGCRAPTLVKRFTSNPHVQHPGYPRCSSQTSAGHLPQEKRRDQCVTVDEVSVTQGCGNRALRQLGDGSGGPRSGSGGGYRDGVDDAADLAPADRRPWRRVGAGLTLLEAVPPLGLAVLYLGELVTSSATVV